MKRDQDPSLSSDRRVLLMKQRSSAIETPDLHYEDDEESKKSISSSDADSTPRSSEQELRVENLDVSDLTQTPKKQPNIMS